MIYEILLVPTALAAFWFVGIYMATMGDEGDYE